ncbi:hypothetical protein DK846_14165 [Methanospirillum lacunae]|uniref:Uncharacterized protein n=1 Tax=Methanospirillum lacunae TaxID=668570 RepID=A0A2V2MWA5_9EURY|nr:hypothetical protein DK846_14165 [Methanospirillum lacunae]
MPKREDSEWYIIISHTERQLNLFSFTLMEHIIAISPAHALHRTNPYYTERKHTSEDRSQSYQINFLNVGLLPIIDLVHIDFNDRFD